MDRQRDSLWLRRGRAAMPLGRATQLVVAVASCGLLFISHAYAVDYYPKGSQCPEGSGDIATLFGGSPSILLFIHASVYPHTRARVYINVIYGLGGGARLHLRQCYLRERERESVYPCTPEWGPGPAGAASFTVSSAVEIGTWGAAASSGASGGGRRRLLSSYCSAPGRRPLPHAFYSSPRRVPVPHPAHTPL